MTDLSADDLKKIALAIKQADSDSSLKSSSSALSDLSTLQKKVSAFLADSQNFQKGDIVRWKKGLKNKKYPKDGQLCVVIEELSTPLMHDSQSPGSPYYREPLDLVVALLDDDSDLVVFHYDKRRFELVEEKV